MHLPIELWMRILELLTHEHTLARPAYVNCFIAAIIQQRATEQDLVPLLPEFELRAWKATRPYYAVSSVVRKAAKRAFLSGVLLQTCSEPLAEVPRRRKGKRTPRRMMGGGGSEEPFYVPEVLARMDAKVGENGARSEPTYLPLEVFETLVYKQCVADPGRNVVFSWRTTQSRIMWILFSQHLRRLAEEGSLLRTVRRVELLAAAPYGELMEEARMLVEDLAHQIEGTWEKLGITDGEVRVLH